MTPTAEMIEGWKQQAHDVAFKAVDDGKSYDEALMAELVRLAFTAGQEAMRERALEIFSVAADCPFNLNRVAVSEAIRSLGTQERV